MHKLQRSLDVFWGLVATERPPEGPFSWLEFNTFASEDVGDDRRTEAKDAQLPSNDRRQVGTAEVLLAEVPDRSPFEWRKEQHSTETQKQGWKKLVLGSRDSIALFRHKRRQSESRSIHGREGGTFDTSVSPPAAKPVIRTWSSSSFVCLMQHLIPLQRLSSTAPRVGYSRLEMIVPGVSCVCEEDKGAWQRRRSADKEVGGDRMGWGRGEDEEHLGRIHDVLGDVILMPWIDLTSCLQPDTPNRREKSSPAASAPLHPGP